MVNYQNGKIYTIRSRIDETLIYIGSTTRELSQRIAQHRNDCKNGVSCSLYDYIVSDDWSEWYIELYEKYPCNDRAELCKKEGEVIREIATINKRIAGRTIKEWREDNAEKIKEYKKNYYEMNADIIKEKTRIHRVVNADNVKETRKKYYENNKDKIKEKSKKNYLHYAEKIKEGNKEKVCCNICGAFMRKNGLGRHQKTKKCTDIASKK